MKKLYVLSIACLGMLLAAGANTLFIANAEETNYGIGDIIEAEDVVKNFGWDENSTNSRYFDETSKSWVSGPRIANGASGKSCAEVGASSTIKFNLSVEETGEYDLFVRAQGTSSLSLSGLFTYNLDGELDGGTLKYTAFAESGTVLVANQNYRADAGATDDEKFDFETWNNMTSWTLAKVGTLTLSEGDHVVSMNLTGGCPNLDYFKVVKANEQHTNRVLNFRGDTHASNGYEQEVEAITLEVGEKLSDYSVNDSQYTGLYARFYNFTSRHPWYGRHEVYAQDIAISESMVSGVNYDAPGTYDAVVKYVNSENLEGYTATLKVIVKGEEQEVTPSDELKALQTLPSVGFSYTKNGEDYTFSNIRISFKGIVASTLFEKLNATGAGIEVKIDQEGTTTEYIDCSNNIGVDGENRYVFGSINVPAENKAVEVTARAYFVVGGEKVFLKATTRSLESAVTDYLSGLVELTEAQEEAVTALAAYLGIGNN